MASKGQTWFLITTSESVVKFTPYGSYTEALATMKAEYNKYKFDPEKYDGKGRCFIQTHRAYIDSPVDGCQRHWCVVSMDNFKMMANKLAQKGAVKNAEIAKDHLG